MATKRIAIVGSGITGIGALWALKYTPHEVHLFEAQDRLGGHTNTVKFRKDDDETDVDTGFIVLNTATYPNFIAFLKELSVDTVSTEMTFGISRDFGKFEWAGTSLGALFAQLSNIFDPGMWRMIFDIVRFNQFALDILSADVPEKSELSEMTIGEYLEIEGYSQRFRDDYLIPMTACIWSTGPDKCTLEFPAITLVRFLWNHHLLSTIAPRPPWKTLRTFGKSYIDSVLKGFPRDRLHLSCPIRNVQNHSNGKVILDCEDGRSELFDGVILACHGDEAYELISETATNEERSILRNFETSENVAYLHSDLALMPQRKVAWSAWNYLTYTSEETDAHPSPEKATQTVMNTGGKVSDVTLTYSMNILQHLSYEKYGPVLVTLNPQYPPSPSTIQGKYVYRHPLYNSNAVHEQEQLKTIQGKRGIWYAGAWTGYGFHEDGLTSGLRAAIDGFGGSVPWTVVDSKYSRGRKPQLNIYDRLLRIILSFIQLVLTFITGPSNNSKKRV